MNFDALIGGVIGLVAAMIILKLVDWIADASYLSPATKRDMDRDVCESMREAGWDEDDIRDFMHRHRCYYDRDEGGSNDDE